MTRSLRRKLFALVYMDESGRERRSWHASRKDAVLIGIVKKGKFRIEEYTF
jgi:hypothetical protein